MKLPIRGLAPLFVLLAVAPLHGALLFDLSPESTGGTILPGEYWIYENTYDGQNFAERIVFDVDVRLTGMSVYTYRHFAAPGREVMIKVWPDVEAAPELGSLSSFVTTLAEVDTDGIGPYGPPSGANLRGVRAHAEFGAHAFVLPANTALWIGMSGWDTNLAPRDLGLFGLADVSLPGDGGMWRLLGDGNAFFDGSVGDMAMRIYGDPVDTPPPPTGVPDGGSSLLLLGFSLTVLAAARAFGRS